jgi:hypothetical protein
MSSVMPDRFDIVVSAKDYLPQIVELFKEPDGNVRLPAPKFNLGNQLTSPLRDLARHQYSRECHPYLQLDIDWPDRFETDRPIEMFGIQCREAVELAYTD